MFKLKGITKVKIQISYQWAKISGKIFAWHLENPLTRICENLLFGDCLSAILDEISRVIRGNEFILDIGTGTGRFSIAISKRLKNGKLIGLELSEELLQKLKRKVEKLKIKNRILLIKGDALACGLKNESVDLVISNSVFHELLNPDKVLMEMIRVLKPNGWLIVTDFRDTRISKFIYHLHHSQSHGPFSIRELETLFTKSGLKNIKVSPLRNWVMGLGMK